MKIGEVRHSSLSSRVLCPGAAGTAPSAAVSTTPVDRVGSTGADDGRPRGGGGSHSNRASIAACRLAAAAATGANAKRIIGVKCGGIRRAYR